MLINFLAVGNITQDRVPGGFRLGGTVSYAAIAALRLGRRPGILTRAAPGAPGLDPGSSAAELAFDQAPLAGIEVCCLPSPVTTTFNNIYLPGGKRIQVVEAVAAPLEPHEMPPEWATVPLVLFGPIAGEVSSDWAEAFPNARVGIMAQGLLRRWDGEGHVEPARWASAAPFLARADAVIFSIEDVQGDVNYAGELARQTRVLVLTEGRNGCTVYVDGVPHQIAPRPAQEVDPTGAGDVFAAAFLIRLSEIGDPLEAAHFANVAASISVEAAGMASVPYRAQVDSQL